MKKVTIAVALLSLFLTGCGSTPGIGAITPPYVDTGIDSESWAVVPSGEFPYGQHDHMSMVEEFEIMVTDVTTEQYAAFLSAAESDGTVSLGMVELQAGEQVWYENGFYSTYPGDPFDGYKHEEEITAGNKLLVPFPADGVRVTGVDGVYTSIPEYANHPMTMVTWFGANAYCEYYGWRLPTEMEWEKAARGTELVDEHGLPYPWGEHIMGNNANYYSSFDVFEKMFGKLGNTTPVGMFNGKTYDGYETLNSDSPYGLYDMAGNVWQWMGDDYPDQHYRMMRGGSFYSYEVDLRVWKNNSAGPQHYGPSIGFRCAR